MPKKPPARSRMEAQQHRPQPKRKDVMLVPTASAPQAAEAGEKATEEPGKTGVTKGVAAKGKEGKTAPLSAKTPAKPALQATRPLAASGRSGRPGQRPALRPHERLLVSRQANLVSAEHYRYVLKDLRLIAVLAAVMFAVIISLTFILPHFLQY